MQRLREMDLTNLQKVLYSLYDIDDVEIDNQNVVINKSKNDFKTLEFERVSYLIRCSEREYNAITDEIKAFLDAPSAFEIDFSILDDE